MKLAQYVRRGLAVRPPDTPSALILLVTSKCNATCVHCFFADELNQTPDLMSLDDYQRLSSELGSMTQLYLAGGEPFIRSDLAEICRIFDAGNRVGNVTIPTNGSLVDRTAAAVEDILSTCACDLMISFSIDGTRETHDTIRGIPRGFDKIHQTYQELARLKQRFPTFRMQVTTVILEQNIDDLPLLMQWVKEHMPDVSAHNFELVRGKMNEYCDQLPSLDRLEAFEEIHRAMVMATNDYLPESRIKSWLAKRMKANLFREAIQVLQEKRQVFDCVAGVEMGVVDYRGDVFLCELMPQVGNVLTDGFRKAWNSQKAIVQRAAIKAKKCHCTHSCFQTNSNLMNPKSYFKMLAS